MKPSSPAGDGARKRRFIRGLSYPGVSLKHLNRVVHFWYAMHSRRRAQPLLPPVCEQCGELVAPKSLGLHYVGDDRRKKSRTPAVTALNAGLPDTWALWCRRCLNKASAKKVSTKDRSRNAFKAYKKQKQAAGTASTTRNGVNESMFPFGIVDVRRRTGFVNGQIEPDGWSVILADHIVHLAENGRVQAVDKRV